MIGAKIECNRGIYMAIKNRIKNYEKEMISVLAELVAFNSVNETATKDAPFGQTNKECLEKALTICERYGLNWYHFLVPLCLCSYCIIFAGSPV